MNIYREQDMLHHMATILVCYGGHFESKMAAKIKKSSDVGEIGFQVDYDVANWYPLFVCYGGHFESSDLG